MFVTPFNCCLYSAMTEVSACGRWLQFAHHAHLSKQNLCLTPTGVFPKIPLSCSGPGSKPSVLPTFCLFERSLPWWMVPRSLPSSGDDANCFRLVGSDICSEELERYTLMVNNLLPPSWELHCLFLLFSNLLHSWEETILNMPLSLLYW